ncbi:MAG TPA: hypothetical protein DDW65_13835, partial [Firmicutes bacterium]|nr:hypothetical protein [Bacillota bacterium]
LWATLRLKVDNVTNKNYWTARYGQIYLGNPRTISLSLTTKF